MKLTDLYEREEHPTTDDIIVFQGRENVVTGTVKNGNIPVKTPSGSSKIAHKDIKHFIAKPTNTPDVKKWMDPAEHNVPFTRHAR